MQIAEERSKSEEKADCRLQKAETRNVIFYIMNCLVSLL